jgi:hypothetical protein
MNGFYVTLTIGDTQHNNKADIFQYPQCHIKFFIMLSVVMPLCCVSCVMVPHMVLQ